MTERLYYTEPYRRECDATIERVERLDGRTAIVLDRTVFYPTSGGQPFDTGTLGSFHVVDVIDRHRPRSIARRRTWIAPAVLTRS